MNDKIKVRISSFLYDILENDALRFGFIKNNKSNKNALLNKLIPTLVEIRKERRKRLKDILKNDYNRSDYENIYSAANTVIDKVYFNDEELSSLKENIWIRPTLNSQTTFDEIENSECKITAQDLSVYIRNILNEYCRLPQYKRETIVFDNELDIFSEACLSNEIIYFTNKETNEKIKAFAFNYVYGFLYDQTNYFVIYDLKRQKIKAIPINKVKNIYRINEKYKPSNHLVELLQNFSAEFDFEKEVEVGE